MKELSLSHGQAGIENFVRRLESLGIDQTLSLRLSKLIEETNETAESCLLHAENPTEITREHMLLEMGDILVTLGSVANYFGSSLDEAFIMSMNKINSRISDDVIIQLKEEGFDGMDLYREAKRRHDKNHC